MSATAESTTSDVSSRDKIFRIVERFLAQRSIDRTLHPEDNLRDVGITSLDMVNIVLVELPANKIQQYTRDPVRITGQLHLNATDPENFLYVLRNATVTEGE